MDKITEFVLSERMAKLMVIGFAIILAAAVTIRVFNDGKVSGTYVPNELKTQDLSLATSQEPGTLSQSAASNAVLLTSAETIVTTGSSELTIPCIWTEDISITLDEFRLMCTTVYCEAGNQNIETQIMVALTILNRLNSEDFPNTVREVIYQDEQYAVTEWENFEDYGWTSSVEQAVTYALEVNDYPEDMFFFRTDHYHKFGQPYIQSGELYFSTKGD